MTTKEYIEKWNKTKQGRMPTSPESRLAKTLAQRIKEKGEQAIQESFLKALNDHKYTSDMWAWVNDLMFLPKQQQNISTSQPQDLNILQALSQELLKTMNKDFMQQVQTQLEDFIQDKTLIKVVEYKENYRQLKDTTHEQFKNVLSFVSMNEPVMLVGPAGTGKNVLAKQVADSLGLDFYFSNAIQQAYEIKGYGDANGHYIKTQFYDAFTKGGLFLLDEIDASIPEALVVLNSAIANRYFDFPVIGRVQAHKDFRVIACANTYGRGASTEYCGRYQLDGASLNRFGTLYIDYDKRIEESLTQDKDLLDFVRQFRKIANDYKAHIIVSYREISRLDKMIHIVHMNIKDAFNSCLFKGGDENTIRMILKQINNKYVDSLL